MDGKGPECIWLRLDLLDAEGSVLTRHDLPREKIVIGRVLSADIRVDDPWVSRLHALVERRPDGWWLTDLSSSHGTYVNGVRIEAQAVSAGDIIRLGRVDLRLTPSPRPLSAEGARMRLDAGSAEKTGSEIPREHERRGVADRRRENAFPEEKRLDERRQGDRRDPQASSPFYPVVDRRLGERRRGDRRHFDITSLERRARDRRSLPSASFKVAEELEQAFVQPQHDRELEVTALWGDHILEVDHYSRPTVLTVGESPRSDYVIPSVGIPDEFPLVTVDDDGGVELAWTIGMSGSVRVKGKIYALEALARETFVEKDEDHYRVSLGEEDFAKLDIGNVHFFILQVPPTPRVKSAPLFDRDPLLGRTTLGSLLLLGLFLIGSAFLPKPRPTSIQMQIENPPRTLHLKVRHYVLPPELLGGSEAGAGSHSAESKKSAAPKTVVAPLPRPSAPPARAQYPTGDRPHGASHSPQPRPVGMFHSLGRQRWEKSLQELLHSGDKSLFRFGSASSSSAQSMADSAGEGIKGVETTGTGNTLTIEGPSTTGAGTGTKGRGIGDGLEGPGRFGEKSEAPVGSETAHPVLLSGLPKDVINAVVEQHRAQIRSCYEASLRLHPRLQGKVVVAFTIQPTGVVSRAVVKETTLAEEGLEQCILSRVLQWEFPRPEAPVFTEVSAYPFYLKPAD